MKRSIGGASADERDYVTKNGRFAGVRVLIFDLDGTLIDSKLDLACSVNAMLAHMGRAEIEPGKIYRMVGSGATTLVERALGENVTAEETRRAVEFFLAYYRAHMLDNTVTYPGVREGLEMLRDRAMAVLTNKPVRFSQQIVAGLGLSQYFQYVYGGNSFVTKKPNPEGANALLHELSAAPREALLVGDSAVDVQTARNAGTWCCGVSYGLDAEGLRVHPPDLMLNSLTELPAHLVAREQ